MSRSIDTEVAKVRNAVYGADVREAIAKSMEETYDACESFKTAAAGSATAAAGSATAAAGSASESAAALPLNTALDTAGKAADAKSVGEAIGKVDGVVSDLKSAFDDIADATVSSNNILNPVGESGYYDATNGTKKSGSGYVRTVDSTKLPDDWTKINVIAKTQFTGTVGVFFYSTESTDSFDSMVGLSSLTISTVNVPEGCKYVRISMPNTNSLEDLSIAAYGITIYDAYRMGYSVKSSALPEIQNENLSQEVLDDISDGMDAYSQFSTIRATNNLLLPAQENGYFSGSVGQTLTKVSSSSHCRSVEPIPFESFTGEFKLILKNAIAGGGYVQIFFLANDKSTIVFTQSVNSANALTLHDYVPSTAKFFVVWANKGTNDFKIADILVSTKNVSSYEVYSTKTTLDDYTSHEIVDRIFNDAKNIVVFGDSIFGMVDDETSVAEIMGKYTNANIINCAFGGTRLSIRAETNGYEQFDFGNLVNCVVSGDYSPLVTTGLPSYYPGRKTRLSKVDFTNVDVVILFYGTNDYMSGVTKAQVLACADYINVLQARYPQIKVYYCSPAYRVYFDGNNQFEYDSNTYNPSQGTLVDYVEWYEEMSNSINIPFVNCYKIGINSANYSQYFTAPDGVHHNASGRALLGEHIARCVMSK